MELEFRHKAILGLILNDLIITSESRYAEASDLQERVNCEASVTLLREIAEILVIEVD